MPGVCILYTHIKFVVIVVVPKDRRRDRDHPLVVTVTYGGCVIDDLNNGTQDR